MKLSTTDTNFNTLEVLVGKGKADTVKVPREALRRLVSDHIVLLALARRSTTIEAGGDQRSLR
jgi:hypothetical protein